MYCNIPDTMLHTILYTILHSILDTRVKTILQCGLYSFYNIPYDILYSTFLLYSILSYTSKHHSIYLYTTLMCRDASAA